MTEEAINESGDFEDYNKCMEEKTERYIGEGFSEEIADSMAFSACEEFLPE